MIKEDGLSFLTGALMFLFDFTIEILSPL